MESNLVFIYDGQCPFCNRFAELLELKSNIPDIQIKDARKNGLELPTGYDMDVNGAILYKDGKIFNGAEAINYICSRIDNPSDNLLKLIAVTFSSYERSKFFFPFLIIARRVLLFLKGIPRKVVF